MKAQAASLPFSPVFAAVVSVVNTKLPQVGELVLIRLISQFRRAFKRNDKVRALGTSGVLDCGRAYSDSRSSVIQQPHSLPTS